MREIEKYAKDYQTNNPFEDIQVGYRRKKVLEFLEKQPFNKKLSILEIGCGMEPLFMFFDNYRNYTIVEPSKIFFNNAQQLSKQLNKQNINFYNYFLENAKDNLVGNRFDVIICSSLLHEVESAEKILNVIYNTSIPNQTLIHINVPNANSFHRLVAKEAGLINDIHQKSENNKLMQQNTVFDLEILSTLVQANGFKIINKGSYFIKPFTHKQMKKMLDSNIIDKNILDGLYNLEKYMPGLGSEIFVELQI